MAEKKGAAPGRGAAVCVTRARRVRVAETAEAVCRCVAVRAVAAMAAIRAPQRGGADH